MIKRIAVLPLIVFLAINIFPQSYRNVWQPPEEIMDTLGIKAGMIIGEAGAGEGYFTIPLAKRLGAEGKLYANDINEDALEELSSKIQEENLSNVEIILGEFTDPLFPAGEMEMIIMVYVIHDVVNTVAWLKNLKNGLKKNAPLIIIDRDPDKYGRDYNHFWRKEKVVSTVASAGFNLSKIYDFLPRDKIYIFSPE